MNSSLSRKRIHFYLYNMKTLLEQIQQRRSLFPADYSGGEIPQEHWEQILEAARWAPNHKKTEPWSYKVVRGKGLQKLGDFMQEQFEKTNGKSGIKARKMAENMLQSAGVILIFMDRDPKESLPEWEEIAAVSMSVQNMWLVIHSLGYGCYWSSPKDFADLSQFEPITVKPNSKFLGFLYLGTVSQQPADLPKRREVADFTEYVD